MPGVIEAEISVTYECRSDNAAMVSLKDKYATSTRLAQTDIRLLKANLRAKYKDCIRECGMRDGDTLWGVTGCVLTGDQDTIVLSSQSQSVGVAVEVGLTPVELVKTGIKVRRHSSSQFKKSRSGHHHFDPISGGTTDNCSGAGCTGKKNQCIFIDLVGFKRGIWGLKAAAIGAPKPGGSPPQESTKVPVMSNSDSDSDGNESPFTAKTVSYAANFPSFFTLHDSDVIS
jgi:hypothetical protein